MTFRVQKRPCKTCIFHGNSPISDERFEELKQQWETEHRGQECHAATIEGQQIGCKGHMDAFVRGDVYHPLADAFDEVGLGGLDVSTAVQVAENMGWIEYIPAPKNKNAKK